MSAKPRKVLMVDDSQLVHRLYELAFNDYPGCQLELHLAGNGYDGLEKLREHPDVELIILDINMPTMSGLEFLSQVKADPALKHIPVALQSTEDSEEDIQRGLEAGASCYLTKPFTPQRIHMMLGLILR